MVKQIVRTELSFFARRCASAALLASGFWGLVATARAQATLPPISIGAGMRTSYVHTFPDSGTDSDRFLLNSARIYINGSVTDTFKFTLNTEYNSSTNNVNVLDAIARMEVSPEFNIWAGRLLPPSDRVNLTGPYYSHHWAVFTDGIENGQPSAFQGRDNGFLYWGDFANKRLKISAGAFDGPSTDGSPEVLGAARVQIDLWDTEPGYYLNSTYYGDKNILAIAGSNQVQGGRTATTVDFLLEKKIMVAEHSRSRVSMQPTTSWVGTIRTIAIAKVFGGLARRSVPKGRWARKV